MTALLWKDYRINRLILIVGAVLLVAPYLIAVLIHVAEARGDGFSAKKLAELLASAGYSAIGLSLLTIALLGGNAIAAERADRSAEFLAYLPPSRGILLLSKAILGIGASLLIWGVNLSIAYGLLPALAADASVLNLPPRESFCFAAAVTSVLLFGVGWAASARMESPTHAAGIAFAAPLVIGGGLMSLSRMLDWPTEDAIVHWYNVFSLVVGPVFFLAGTWYYLRRVEP